jgi:Tol biopolymer transport system component
MKPTTIQKIWILAVGLLSPVIITKTGVCTISFTDADSSIAIDTTNSSMAISNASKIIGWGQRSVVKATGDNASSAWIEGYTSGSVVGQAGQAGSPAVTKIVSTNLVDANSNAINTTGPLLRATSNLLLYVARTYSSSILVLRSRADSTNVSFRGTSNAVNALYQQMAVPTTGSIDGTVFAKYVTKHYVFHNGAWNARGWIRFNDGFTVMPQAAVSMDTLTTVSGAIDLRDTGVLKLNNDLYLSHNVTLTAGGYIKGNAANYGQANTIFMGGDLTLAPDNYAKVLHITGDWANNGQSGDLIIDGCGHTLNIGSQAQLFVDTNVTLTLRNMTIKTSPASLMKPAIQLASLGSKLALDNVMFDLGADFQFDQGQLFIHDEVAVTGTSAFIYQSPKPSYITSGATWSFEQGTTFSIAPATYTDQPFTAGTATSNNFIVLADQSAALSLSGCSFKTTFTGARFSKGMVLFDNKVAIDTQAGSEISGLGTGVTFADFITTVSSAAFSPDGRYVAVVGLSSNPAIYVYRFNGAALGTAIFGDGYGGNAMPAVAWSPDGKFIAFGGDASPQLRIYRFGGTAGSSSQVTSQSFGLIVNSISWSPDGKYLAVGGNNSTQSLIIYRFNGTSLTQVTTAQPSGAIQVNGVAWSPDGKYLGVTSRGPDGADLNIYSFNGTTFPQSWYAGTSGSGADFAWSPDGRYLAWSTDGAANSIRMSRFDGNSITPINGVGTSTSAQAFSPDGRYLMSCGGTNYTLWRVTPLISAIASDSFGTVATTVAWSPDSKYVLVGGTNGSTDLMVFPVTRTATSATTQGFSNGLLFGDKAKGVNFDANVNVLSGAVVKVKGMVKDDSF